MLDVLALTTGAGGVGIDRGTGWGVDVVDTG